MEIDAAIAKIKATGMDLEKESDAAGFLGVDITRHEEDGRITLTQVGLANKIIHAMGLDDANPKMTPAPKEPLGRDSGRCGFFR